MQREPGQGEVRGEAAPGAPGGAGVLLRGGAVHCSVLHRLGTRNPQLRRKSPTSAAGPEIFNSRAGGFTSWASSPLPADSAPGPQATPDGHAPLLVTPLPARACPSEIPAISGTSGLCPRVGYCTFPGLFFITSRFCRMNQGPHTCMRSTI